MFFNPNTTANDHQHINTAVSIAKDDEGRIWVYFGTGRFWSYLDRTAPYMTFQNSFYGIKEPIVNAANCDPNDPDDPDCKMTYAMVGAKETELKNVTGIQVYDEDTVSGGVSPVTDADADGDVDFHDLEKQVRNKRGWYINFPVEGERNIGQAAVLGHLVTFATYVPNNDLCLAEGSSFLYALYYKTGTAFYEGVLLTEENNWTGRDAGGRVEHSVFAGRGFTTTPNLHTGREEGSTAFVQTSTGAIIRVSELNPGMTHSEKVSWKDSFEMPVEEEGEVVE